TCKPLPSCASLGYTQTSCPSNRAALKCPFDTAKVYCAASATSDCKVGSIYYSDDTCSENRINSKTPIGIVFDTTNRLIFSLTTNAEKSFQSGNYLLSSLVSSSGSSDVNGENNTASLLAYGEENNAEFPAAEYCHNMTTGGKTWYLPAAAEILPIRDLISDVTEYENLSTKIFSLGGSRLPNYDVCNGYSSNNRLWLTSTISSSEYNEYNGLIYTRVYILVMDGWCTAVGDGGYVGDYINPVITTQYSYNSGPQAFYTLCVAHY
ncbi:MAG: hypothetical protein IJ660_01460, partial [Alphaproteobacteria bacterium]|nr:hypothetical protein [Alphaproteobacteria bacterium]